LLILKVVRKKGLEPSRPCGRQPLKTIRLGATAKQDAVRQTLHDYEFALEIIKPG